MPHAALPRGCDTCQVEPPRRQRLSVLDNVVADEMLEFRHAHFAHRKVVLFRIGLALRLRQPGSQKCMGLLVGIAARDVDLAKALQFLRHQPCLFTQLFPRNLVRIDVVAPDYPAETPENSLPGG